MSTICMYICLHHFLSSFFDFFFEKEKIDQSILFSDIRMFFPTILFESNIILFAC